MGGLAGLAWHDARPQFFTIDAAVGMDAPFRSRCRKGNDGVIPDNGLSHRTTWYWHLPANAGAGFAVPIIQNVFVIGQLAHTIWTASSPIDRRPRR